MRTLRTVTLLSMVAFTSVYSLAKVPRRSTSDNGQATAKEHWKLSGRSQLMARRVKGTKISFIREVVCLNQDVDAGECDLNGYLFIFQLQSTATNVSVRIGNLLPGFSEAGVMECNAPDDPDDPNGNNQELCTTDTATPSLADLETLMTATPNKANSSVTFTIPNFPAFPVGSDPEEGQGLTIYVRVNQAQPVPVDYPTITIF